MIEVTENQLKAHLLMPTKKELQALEDALEAWTPSRHATLDVVLGHMDDYFALRLRKILLSSHVAAFTEQLVSFRVQLNRVTKDSLSAFFKPAARSFPTDMVFACGEGEWIGLWQGAVVHALRKRRLGFKTAFDFSRDTSSFEQVLAVQKILSNLIRMINLTFIYPEEGCQEEKSEVVDNSLLRLMVRLANPPALQCTTFRTTPRVAPIVSRAKIRRESFFQSFNLAVIAEGDEEALEEALDDTEEKQRYDVA
ncbi:MAG: hypothetical protein K0U37_07650 [Gammaproteobacteria bacterium]|nr:hypothetical protein [Gammaproteobacteria bacterium]